MVSSPWIRIGMWYIPERGLERGKGEGQGGNQSNGTGLRSDATLDFCGEKRTRTWNRWKKVREKRKGHLPQDMLSGDPVGQPHPALLSLDVVFYESVTRQGRKHIRKLCLQLSNQCFLGWEPVVSTAALFRFQKIEVVYLQCVFPICLPFFIFNFLRLAVWPQTALSTWPVIVSLVVK